MRWRVYIAKKKKKPRWWSQSLKLGDKMTNENRCDPS